LAKLDVNTKKLAMTST